MSIAKDERLEVMSYSGILGVFLLFALVLYLLYPKEMLEQNVLKESSNYDLTEIYLENMLRQDPDNTDLMIALANTAIESGNIDLATRLLKVLETSKDEAVAKEAKLLRYKVLKREYLIASTTDKRVIKKELIILVIELSRDEAKSQKSITYWYGEALWLHQDESASMLVDRALVLQKESVYWLNQCYALSGLMHNTQRQMECLDGLSRYDKKQREKWLATRYYLSVAQNDIDEADQTLVLLASYGEKWIIERANLALRDGHYVKASDIYLEAMANTKSSSAQKRYLKHALEVLQQGNEYTTLVTRARRYEQRYLNDSEMTRFFLKLYMGSDNIKEAARFSKEILKARGRR